MASLLIVIADIGKNSLWHCARSTLAWGPSTMVNVSCKGKTLIAAAGGSPDIEVGRKQEKITLTISCLAVLMDDFEERVFSSVPSLSTSVH